MSVSDPYRNFKGNRLWHGIEAAIQMLEKGGYLQCTKDRDLVIGFIHHQLDARGLVKPQGFEPQEETERERT